MDHDAFATPEPSPRSLPRQPRAAPSQPRSAPSSPRAAQKLAHKWAYGRTMGGWLRRRYARADWTALGRTRRAEVLLGATLALVISALMGASIARTLRLGAPAAELDAFGRPHEVPARCLALGPAAPAWNAEENAPPPLRCTFWCGAQPSGPAACLVGPLHAVLDMHLLRIAPLPGTEACRPVRETWSDDQTHLACRWDAIELQPYGLRIVGDPAVALAVQLAAEEAARALRPQSK